MADISKIKLDDVTYNIKDTFARDKIKTASTMSEGLGYKRIGRKIDVYPGAFTSNNGGYCGLQGGVADSANTFTYIQLHMDGSGTIDSDTAKIVKINLTTGEIVKSAELQLEHGGSIGYDRTTETYYVVPSKSNISSGGYKIIKLDKDFNVLSSTPTNKNYDGISVDENGDLYVGFTYKSSSYAYHVYKLNKSTYDEEKEIILQTKQTDGTGQDLSVNNGKIIIASSDPNFIEIFDMDGVNIKNYAIKDFYYKVGELENISTWDGENYVFASQFKYSSSSYFLDEFFTFNILTNRVEDDIIYLNNVNVRSMFVKASSTSFNPTGESTKAFKVIDEVSGIVLPNGCQIAIDEASTYYLKALSISPVEINATQSGTTITAGDNTLTQFIGSKVFINGGSNNNLTMYGVDAYKNSNVYLNHVILTKKINDYLVRSAQNSVVTIANCTFTVTETYTNGYFYTDRATIIYADTNSSIVDHGTIRYFNGNIEFLKPIKLLSTDVTPGSAFQLNGGNYNDFKSIKLFLTDNNQLDYHPRYANTQNAVFCNLSASGAGTNNFYNIVITKSSSNINYTRANSISFNASGVMSVNTSPTFNILDVYVM